MSLSTVTPGLALDPQRSFPAAADAQTAKPLAWRDDANQSIERTAPHSHHRATAARAVEAVGFTLGLSDWHMRVAWLGLCQIEEVVVPGDHARSRVRARWAIARRRPCQPGQAMAIYSNRCRMR
jgi:hypothetical protein